ncbi:MAG: c-type cytochrome [Spirochaetia bacterium]|nr:c-type cytochrome [Spirochaetia bacterium]
MSKIKEEFRDDEEVKDEPGWLPGWWMGIFYFTIAFSVYFTIDYHLIRNWTQEKQFAEEYKSAPAAVEETITLKADGSNPFRGNNAAVSEGEKMFRTMCSACHKPDGTGLIGPNLMDKEWLHGASDKEIYSLILTGVPQDKMKQKKSPIGGPPSPMPPKGGAPISDTKILKIMAWLAEKNSSLIPAK